MSRFAIAARTHPEIDWPAYFGSYEFSVAPNSLFATHGCLRLSTEKASIAQELLKLQQEFNESTESFNESTKSNITKVNIFDGMVIANTINIKKEKTRDESATSFTNIVKRESLSYNEERIILSSLKTFLWTKRTNGIAVRYKVTDKTNIENLTKKQFLANIETENDLTMYLAGKVDI